ncbi:MAG TPA: prolyl oligopeptidase family serine peptidase, partial [Gemmataceae bacterium]
MRGIACLAAVTLSGVLMEVTLAADKPISYPPTKRVEVVDEYHGVRVPDPYRWLEEDVRTSPAVEQWVAEQNKVTDAYLAAIPGRDAIRKRLTRMWDYPKFSAPFKEGGRYFFFKNDGLQNQNVLYVTDTLGGEPKVLIDPNKWSEDGTVALSNLELADGAKYLAYSVAEAGSDWQTWKVLDVATAKPLADELKWSKFSGASWTKDGKGFFYCRYPEPEKGAEFQSLNKDMKVMYHRVGTPQSDDVLVYHRPDQPEWGFQTTVTEDGRYLIITIWKGTDDRYRITYKDLTEPYGLPVDLITEFENDYTFVANDGPVFYFRTNLDAPNNRVIAIDTRDPRRENWKEIIPEAKEKLESVNCVGNLFVAEYLKDAKSQVKLFAMDGSFVREVELPGIGTAGGFGGKRTDTETFYTFSSFATPTSIYRYDLITGKSELWRRSEVPGFDPDAYEVKQVFCTSKDGTRVPIFITHLKGISLDGNNPVLLYGYGGFNISLTPSFSISRACWLEMGGVFALANLRGGGEYGEKWHKAGTKLN